MSVSQTDIGTTLAPARRPSSGARTYFLLLGTMALLLLAAIAGLDEYGIRTGHVDSARYDLFDYQLDRIAAAKGIDTLFLGDSTAGNAIDTETWSRLSGKPSLNAALTGYFGYAGTYNMLRAVLDRGLRPHLVVIMQTIEMPERQVSWKGYVATAGDQLDMSQVPLLQKVMLHLDLDVAWGVIRYLDPAARESPVLDRDYLRQRRPRKPVDVLEEHARRTLAGHVKPDKALFLTRIAELCDSHHINCLYAHGPIVDFYCKGPSTYIADATAFVVHAGLHVLPGTPTCVSYDTIGDDPDHIRPELRPAYTERFFHMVQAQGL